MLEDCCLLQPFLCLILLLSALSSRSTTEHTDADLFLSLSISGFGFYIGLCVPVWTMNWGLKVVIHLMVCILAIILLVISYLHYLLMCLMWDKYRKGDISHHPNIQTLERVNWSSPRSNLSNGAETCRHSCLFAGFETTYTPRRWSKNLDLFVSLHPLFRLLLLNADSEDVFLWREALTHLSHFHKDDKRSLYSKIHVQSWFLVWLESFIHWCLTASRFLLPSSCRNLFLEGTAPKMGMFSESYDILTVQCLRK